MQMEFPSDNCLLRQYQLNCLRDNGYGRVFHRYNIAVYVHVDDVFGDDFQFLAQHMGAVLLQLGQMLALSEAAHKRREGQAGNGFDADKIQKAVFYVAER
jgi:hypothetical protein